MDVKVATALRAPFPTEQIGLLPRVTCSDCADRSKNCSRHERSKCNDCGSYISAAHIHLDFVGHADVTSRLIEVDPDWSWEPLATDDNGLPLFDTDDHDRPVGLWIKLTVGGVTRLGYGSVPASQNDAVKVLIGDAIRNAAMRFGVAVDLWAKGDRRDPSAENATASAGQAARQRRAQQKPPAESGGDKRGEPDSLSAARVELLQVAKETGLGSNLATIGQHFESFAGVPVAKASLDQVKSFVAHLREDAATRNGQPVAS